MIEEGGPSGNPNYHAASDTLATLNLELHANVTRGLVAALATFANQ